MNAVRLGNEIVLSGPPRKVTAIVAIDVARTTVVPIAIRIGEQPSIFRGVLRAIVSGSSEIRLRLPDDMTAGSYAGEATIHGKPQAVIVEVEAAPRLRLQPRQTTVTVKAASSVEFVLTLMNSGNVAFDIPKAATIDLDDADGQDRALGRTLRAALGTDERRVDRFFEELRASHGGEARVVVKRGAGRLLPGDVRELACALEIPDGVRPGRSYVGAWQIGPSAHVIVTDIMASARPIRPRATK